VASFAIEATLPASPSASWAFVVAQGHDIEPLTFVPRDEQGPGVLNDLEGRLFGLIPIRGVSRTLVWEPPVRCVFESVKPAWPVRTKITETFEAAAGATRHRVEYEVSPVGPLGRVFAPLVSRMMKRSRREYQRRLAAALRAHA
jgi:hypothetical protein